MKSAFPPTSLVAVVIGLWICGCDVPPRAPRAATSGKTLTVRQDDAEEVRGALALETAHVAYQGRLEALRDYYERVGNADKHQAALNELKTLHQAQMFRYGDLPEIIPPERVNLEGIDERLLVEYIVAARRAYLEAVDKLIALYESQGNRYRAAFVRSIKERFDPVRIYMYFPAAEIPPADLHASDSIPEADAMFAQARKLFFRGKGLLHTFVTTSYRTERRALVTFMELIEKYPTSNKIALSAYYIADIYKEYFNEDVRAVLWYERAWQWDPNVPEPARFQAGTVYDLRLHNPEKAVQCYAGAIEHEQFNQSNVRYAKGRIAALTGK